MHIIKRGMIFQDFLFLMSFPLNLNLEFKKLPWKEDVHSVPRDETSPYGNENGNIADDGTCRYHDVKYDETDDQTDRIERRTVEQRCCCVGGRCRVRGCHLLLLFLFIFCFRLYWNGSGSLRLMKWLFQVIFLLSLFTTPKILYTFFIGFLAFQPEKVAEN